MKSLNYIISTTLALAIVVLFYFQFTIRNNQVMQILLIGVGKSSMHIIEELSKISGIFDFTFVVADLSASNLESKCNGLNCIQLKLDTGSIEELTPHIAASFIVISMLPPAFHVAVAKVCLMHRAHLITPSYISDEMLMLDTQAKNADLIFLNEMGLDPGIDHMFCMKIIQEQKSQGASSGYLADSLQNTK